MRRNSPQTARADSQEEVAMRYDDVRFVSKTAEEHERDAYGSTFLTGEEARKILAAHKVPGRSKLDADAAAARSTSRRSSRKAPRLPSSPCHLYPENGI